MCIRSVCDVIAPLRLSNFVIVDVDIGVRSNNRGRAPAAGFNPSHIYGVSYTRRSPVATLSSQPLPSKLGDVTSSQRRDSLPRDQRRVTFADDSPIMVDCSDVGGPDDDQNAGNSSRYGSSELSDITSVTSGSYYMEEDSHQQPVSFIFV